MPHLIKHITVEHYTDHAVIVGTGVLAITTTVLFAIGLVVIA